MKLSRSRRGLRHLITLGSCAMLATGGLALSAPSGAHAATSQDGLYHASAPTRLLDTRAAKMGGPVSSGKTVFVPRAKLISSGLPANGVQSVVVNLTVTGGTGSGWATIFSGSTAPSTSNINFTKGWTGAVSTTVALASGSGLSIKIGGTGIKTNVIVDLEGWYSDASYSTANGSGFDPWTPERWLDTRTDGGGQLPAQYVENLAMDWDATGAWAGTTPTALLVNLTALKSPGSGSLSLYNGSENENSWPTTSSVNFGKGEISPNTGVVPLLKNSDGSYSFGIANTGYKPVDVLVDVLGVYYSGNVDPTFKHVVVKPTRVMNFTPVGANQTIKTTLGSGIGNAAATGAVEGTLTGYKPTVTNYQTVWEGSGSVPKTSNLNVAAGGVRANGFLARETSEETLNLAVYNSAGNMKAIVDITGRFDWTGPINAAGAQRQQAAAKKSAAALTVATRTARQ